MSLGYTATASLFRVGAPADEAVVGIHGVHAFRCSSLWHAQGASAARCEPRRGLCMAGGEKGGGDVDDEHGEGVSLTGAAFMIVHLDLTNGQ